MKNTIWILLMFNLGLFAQNTTDLQLIAAKMADQEVSWNKGNIKGFMKHYWKSDTLTFTGKNGIQYGWQTTLENYLKSYPNKTQMGKLTFTNISIKKIDLNTITVIGKWNLDREDKLDDLNGYYSLIWQKKDNHWVIISDHSS